LFGLFLSATRQFNSGYP